MRESLSLVSRFWARLEDWSIASALFLMMLLPIIEIVLRQFDSGIFGAAAILQHLVLFIAMIGGVVAAREGRLLSLSNFRALLPQSWLAFAQTFSGSVGFAFTLILCVGSYLFCQMTMDPDKLLFPGMPLWVAKLIMPAGFGLLALRVLWNAVGALSFLICIAGLGMAYAGLSLKALFDNHGDAGPAGLLRMAPSAFLLFFCLLAFVWLIRRSESRWLHVLPVSIVGVFALVGLYPFDAVEGFVWPLLILILISTVLGAPIFVTLGGAAIVLFWGWGGYYEESAQIVALNLYDLVKSPMLVTLPLFTLAGYFLAQGNSSQRLVRLIESIFGGMRGSAAIVTVLVCAFFTTFTGASGVTILALGGLLLPVLSSSGYDERTSIGLLTGSGALGVLFPPCLPLILYVVVASNTKLVSISLNEIFLGGALPGILLVLMTIAWGIWKQPVAGKEKLVAGERNIARALFSSAGELLLPVVALGALFSGYATPVEAASVSALYAFLLYLVDGIWIRKARIAKELPKMMAECGLLVGGVLLILGVAMGFTNYLVTEMIPDRIVEWAKQGIESPLVFLLALNVFLVIVGCMMDIFSAIIVVVPLIVPLGVAFGINPIHLGIVFLANLQLGYITPPIGMNLFLASYRFEKPMSEIIKATLPMLFVFIVGVLLITYAPFLTTWLPALLAD